MYVYILANRYGTIYTGSTNSLIRRVYEHKNKLVPGFTARYGIDKLVYFEQHEEPYEAVTRERRIKEWPRAWRIQLVESMNTEWRDLYGDLLG